MTSKIFRNSFLVGVAVFFLSIALFMGVLYQYFGSQLLIQLESEAALAAVGWRWAAWIIWTASPPPTVSPGSTRRHCPL